MKTLAPIGSVSSGTMRNQDLIPRFVELLSDLNEARSLEWKKHFANELEATREYGRLDSILGGVERRRLQEGYIWGHADDDLEELFVELNNFSPPYFYFGAHPGDGADYGFWLSDEVQQQVEEGGGLIVSDTSEVPDDFNGEVLHVNDHGNCTLYVANNGKLDEVWGVV